MPLSDGCSPPETFRFAPSLPLRFACGPLPLTCPRVGMGPGGYSRPHLRHCISPCLFLEPYGHLAVASVVPDAVWDGGEGSVAESYYTAEKVGLE